MQIKRAFVIFSVALFCRIFLQLVLFRTEEEGDRRIEALQVDVATRRGRVETLQRQRQENASELERARESVNTRLLEQETEQRRLNEELERLANAITEGNVQPL